MMTRLAVSCLSALVSTTAFAQTPFDMSPELNLRTVPQEPVIVEEAPAQPAAPVVMGLERHFLPQTGIRFEGEIGTRAIDFYLTEAQAAAPASLDMSVLNSIVVAPEYSELAVSINGTELGAAPIEFAAAPAPVAFEVPEGLLTAGRNRIEIAASQRHRTDCSVSSTYELWTEVYSAGTVLDFTGEGLERIEGLGELPAVGLNGNGAVALRFLIPEIETTEARTAALRLSQYLALALKAPSVEITLIDGLDGDAPQADGLTVVMGTADALPETLAEFSDQAAGGPLAGIAEWDGGGNTLVVSGPNWNAVEMAARSLMPDTTESAVDLGGLRSDLPDSIPVISGRSSVALSALGVDTVAFNGRRYHTALRFALPADFYAEMYSEAELVLNAAYSSVVLPGSQLEIYVNGQIASVIPILTTDGGAFRNSRLRIPMTNFRPGINDMYIETVLLTQEDAVCPPGLSGRAAARFLFSSESEISFPDFGRIAQYPNLSALAGTGMPYAEIGEVPMFVGTGRESVQAAMMLMGRLALSSGRVIEARSVSADALDPGANAIVVAPMEEFSPELLTRARIVDLDNTGDLPIVGDGEDALQRWQESTGMSSGNLVQRAQDWVAGQLGLMPENFWLFRREDGAYLPQSADAVVMSQARQAEGGVWTMLTIPNASAFADATARMVAPATWQQVGGRVSAVGVADESVLVLQPRNVTLVPTQPLSFANLRLVAANWMSTNVLGYALLLAAAVILLTIATSLLLRAGRRDR